MSNFSFIRWILPVVLLISASIVFTSAQFKGGKVDFSTDIKPLLNRKCISCHGGVKKSGGFSMLFEEEAFAETESGNAAIVAGKPDKSELIRRIEHHDPEVRMPLESDPLTKAEIKLLRRWIKEGAKWGDHWAYEPVENKGVPSFSFWDKLFGRVPEKWENSPIDAFVYKTLRDSSLNPSPQADKATLLRRLSLDLTGLPPQTEDIQDFLNDDSANAYEQRVDSLLSSPHFGEKWAAMWMDLARYADTKGYERDPHREIWQYRDWLINTFNEDKPFDEFTIEQLAGDLLPEAGKDQFIATAFHRNTMNNDEGGTDNEEYRVAATLDRVNTTWEVWMGTSFGCVQCHSHPYDPFVQEEYYEFLDFFNNQRDEDTYQDAPNFKIYKAETDSIINGIKNWISEEEGEKAAREMEQFLKITEPKLHPHYCDSLNNATHADTKRLHLRNKGFCRIPQFDLSNKKHIWINAHAPKGGLAEFRLGSNDGPLLAKYDFPSSSPANFQIPINETQGKHDIYISFSHPKEANTFLRWSWMVFTEELPGEGKADFPMIKENILKVLNSSSQKTPILVENPPQFRRETRVFERGNWLVGGKKVNANVPSSLPSLPEDQERNRLTLAKWIASPENPLTSRVAVNRFWEQIFGIGLVETQEDFGSQGMNPSHPELLDYLAYQFSHDYGWSVKRLLKEIVMSAAYQQQSHCDEELLFKDPYNRLLARGPRVRLSAEQIRDQALAASGILSEKMFGKSVMPPQPDGVWQVVYNGSNWKESKGEDRRRRALYTYWRRTSPYPSMVTFDAPSREYCVARRIRTNTPLQALVMLNDPVYLEAAVALAKKMNTGSEKLSESLKIGYFQILGKQPETNILNELGSLYHDMYQHYENNPSAICELLPGEEFPDTRMAALVTVANTLLNLDEFITKS